MSIRSTTRLAGIGALTMCVAACASAGPGPRAGAEPSPTMELAPAPFQLYDADGRSAEIPAVTEWALEVDVVFVGERHGDPGAHAFQLKLLEALVEAAPAAGRPLVVSMEMFERDVQLAVDEYLAGLISEEQFLASARPWANYERDYRPVLELAREEGLPVVAANAPRRYVNRVSRLGPEGLSDLSGEARAYLPPLPYPGPSDAYRAEWNERMAALAPDAGHGATEAHGHGGEDDPALQAQALWDAAMAHAIHLAIEGEASKARAVPDGAGRPLVVHLTGSFHVENRTGTPEALRHYRPGARDLIITTRAVADPADFGGATRDLDVERLADLILLTPTGPGTGDPARSSRARP